jgi:hypothetical protein
MPMQPSQLLGGNDATSRDGPRLLSLINAGETMDDNFVSYSYDANSDLMTKRHYITQRFAFRWFKILSIFNYATNSMELNPSAEAAKFPTFYETWRFITVLIRAPLLIHILSQINRIHITPSYHSKIYFNSIPTYVLVFPVAYFLLAFSPKSYVRSSSPNFCYMPHPSHPPWLDYCNYTWWKLQITKLLIMQFSPFSCHLISLRSKYLPQHLVLKQPQSIFLP